MTLRDSNLLLLLAAVVLPLAAVGASFAADDPLTVVVVQDDPKQAPGVKSRPQVDAESEQAALEFAGEHHPELVKLLTSLRDMQPKEYTKAISELSRASDRLTRTKVRSSDRYELDLAVWKLDSRIHLLAARIAMSKADGQQEELKTLIQQRLDARLAVLKFDRQRQQERLKSLDDNINKLEERREATVEREFSRLVKIEKPKTRKQEKPARPPDNQ